MSVTLRAHGRSVVVSAGVTTIAPTVTAAQPGAVGTDSFIARLVTTLAVGFAALALGVGRCSVVVTGWIVVVAPAAVVGYVMMPPCPDGCPAAPVDVLRRS